MRMVEELDLTILLPSLLLALIGVAMVYSATFAKADVALLYLKQVVWIAAGMVAMLFFASFNFQVMIERYATPAHIAVLIMLAFILAAGDYISGSRRWINLGPLGIQPSEFAKITTTLILARFLASRQNRLKEWTTTAGAFLLAGIPMLLILKEPDLGTALVFIPLVFALLFIVGVSYQRLFAIAGSFLVVSPVIWFLIKDYQRRRIMVFLNPAYDTLGAGYNVIQSQIAIGSGGLFGKGWLSGTQGQLRFVPEHHTDFIFSVCAEEWGLIGGIVLLILFTLLLLQLLRVARVARDMSGSLAAIGLTIILFTQISINLCVAMGILPVTGMTLPFISYGGSSMITCMSMLGIIMSVWTSRTVK